MKRNKQVVAHKLARQRGLLFEYERPFHSRLVEDLELGPYTGFKPNKNVPIHGWFQCREGFSRHLVATFVEQFTRPGDCVLDPFSGVGETLLTSKELDRDSCGIEVMPIFVFVASVKARQDHYDVGILQQVLSELQHLHLKEAEDTVDDFAIIRKAYADRRTVREILYLDEWIAGNVPLPEADVVRLALVSASGDASRLIKDGAFPRQVSRQPKPLLEALTTTLAHFVADIQSYRSVLFLPPRNTGAARITQGDARSGSLYSQLPRIDLVVTSPPYLNRYDYTRIYEPELALFLARQKKDMRAIRFSTMRSHVETTHDPQRTIQSRTLADVVETLSEVHVNNRLIPDMVAGYFEDLKQVLANAQPYLRAGARIVLVVGNVFYSGVLIPVDVILAEVAEELGLGVEQIRITKYKGTSEQQLARYGLDHVTKHLSRESIVILVA